MVAMEEKTAARKAAQKAKAEGRTAQEAAEAAAKAKTAAGATAAAAGDEAGTTAGDEHIMTGEDVLMVEDESTTRGGPVAAGEAVEEVGPVASGEATPGETKAVGDKIRLLNLERFKHQGEMAGLTATERILALTSGETAQLFDVLALYNHGDKKVPLAEICEIIKGHAREYVSYALHYSLPCSCFITARVSSGFTGYWPSVV